jgi:hypothetical protein
MRVRLRLSREDEIEVQSFAQRPLAATLVVAAVLIWSAAARLRLFRDA